MTTTDHTKTGLDEKLSYLKLSYMRENYESLAKKAAQKHWTHDRANQRLTIDIEKAIRELPRSAVSQTRAAMDTTSRVARRVGKTNALSAWRPTRQDILPTGHRQDILPDILPRLPQTQRASADYAVVSCSDVRRRPLTKPPQQRCQAPEITGPRVGMAFASIDAA